MIKISNTVLLCTLTLLFSGCDGNYRNVKVKGLVSDAITSHPIPNAEVKVICWVYDTEIWESKPIQKNGITDSNGRFRIDFEKGEALHITVSSVNYREYRDSITLKKNVNHFDIKLKKTD